MRSLKLSTRLKLNRVLIGGLVSATAMVVVPAARAAVVTVTPAQPNGWHFITYDEAGNPPTNTSSNADGYSGSFVQGPSTPPLGTGSVRLQTGPLGGGAVKLETKALDGVKLANLTQLSYSTFVTHNSGGGAVDNQQAPYVQIPVTWTSGGTTFDDRLFFEPVYQTGQYPTVTGAGGSSQPGDVPDQRGGDGAAPKVGVWENYDILHGGFWTDNAGNGGPPLDTISHYLAAHPDATIVDSATADGFQVVAGFGGPTDWGNFDGNVDNITFATAGGSTTYNFEVPEPATLGTALLLGGGLLMRRPRRQRD